MNKRDKITQSVAILVVFQFASKLLGFVRESLIGNKFGSNAETDAFFMALSIITLFQSVLGSAINTTLIPILTEVEHNEGGAEKRRHLNIFLNSITLLSIVLSGVGYIFAPSILKITASGFEKVEFEFLLLLTRVGLPALLFNTVQGVYRSFLQSEGSFIESAMSQFPFNLVYISYLLIASQRFGVVGLMVIQSIATFSTILLQFPELNRLNYRYQFLIDFKDKYLVKTFHLMPPILLSVAISDVNQMVDKAMASSLSEGSISALNYASKLSGFTVGIFVSAIVTVVYPLLAQAINQENIESFKKAVITGVNMIFLIMIPAAVGMAILAQPIVRIAFERGMFDSLATQMTAGALVFYGIESIFSSAKIVLIRAFFSLQDTKIAMINSAYMLILNVIFNLMLVKFMGHRGLALATAISSVLTFIALFIRLRKKIGSFGIAKLLRSTIKIVFSSVIMGIVVFILWKIIPASMKMGTLKEGVSLFLAAGVGVTVYFVLIYILKIDEFNELIDKLKSKFIK